MRTTHSRHDGYDKKGGYVVLFYVTNGTSSAAANPQVQRAHTALLELIDEQTSDLVLELVLYNPYLQMFTYYELFWEFQASGGIRMRRRHTNIRSSYYSSASDILRTIFEVAYILLFAFYVFIEIVELVESVKNIVKKYHKIRKREEARAQKREDLIRGMKRPP